MARSLPVPAAAILAVAHAHDSVTAAAWAGVAVQTVNRHRRAVGELRGPGHPSRDELERRKVRFDCECPMCRGARMVSRMHRAGYAVPTIARALGLPVEFVRQAVRVRRVDAEWIELR